MNKTWKKIPALLSCGIVACLFLSVDSLHAQGGPRADQIGEYPNPIGSPGVKWYSTMETARAEAERSNRPIFFMAATATCGGVSGVF